MKIPQDGTRLGGVSYDIGDTIIFSTGFGYMEGIVLEVIDHDQCRVRSFGAVYLVDAGSGRMD